MGGVLPDAPIRARVRFTTVDGKLEIDLDARRRWMIAPFLFWLAISLVLGGFLFERPSLYFWGVVWVLIVLSTARKLLWLVGGRERIWVDREVLAVRRELFGLGRARRFPAREVRNLRYAPAPLWRDRLAPVGVIAFEYAGRTVSFAGGIGDSDIFKLMESVKHAMAYNENQKL